MSFAYRHRSRLIVLSLGVVAGLLGGLLGIGGGSVVVPALVFFLNFDQKRAHGTSLCVALFISASSVATYWLHGLVDMRVAAELAAGGVVGAVLGARTANAVHSRTLKYVFSVFMGLLGLRMIAAALVPGGAAHGGIMEPCLLRNALIVGTGLITGFLSALLGIGGGIVMIPAMVIGLGIEQKLAQGISLAAMMITASTGLMAHTRLRNVDYRVGVWTGAGAIVGSIAGASVATSVSSAFLKLGFGVLMFVMAVLLARRKERVEEEEI